MGNDPIKYIQYNFKEKHEKVLDGVKNQILKSIFIQYSQRNGFLTKENFNKIIRLDDDILLDKVFDAFKSQRDKMFFNDLSYFYISFANKDLKNILLSFLIFGKHEKIPKSIYSNNISSLLSIDENFNVLGEKKTIEQINFKRENQYFHSPEIKFFSFNHKEEEYISKELFITFLRNNKIDFSFYDEIKNSSELSNERGNKRKHYVCDCLKKDSKNGKTEDSFEEIKQKFSKDELVVKAHLSFENLEKLMKEYKVNEKLIKLIIKYFKAYTMKNSINFNDFMDLILKIKNLKDKDKGTKKSFLFKMILTIHNQKTELKGEELKNFFQIENEECKLEEVINQEKFEALSDPIIHTAILEYVEYMENLGYLPYVRYNMKPEDQESKKKIINFILNEKSAEDYLKENFDKCNKFYPINKKFWDSLTNNDKIDQSVQTKIELKIDNSLIAIKDEIYYVTKEDEKKNPKQKSENENKKGNEIVSQNKQDNIETNNVNKNEIKTMNEIKEGKKEGSNEKGETKKNEEKTKKESIEEKNIKCVKGKLREGMKYGEDYVIICGEIYEKIFQYFEFDILVELDKTFIFNEPIKEEEKKPEVEQKENKKEEKDEIKNIPPENLEIDKVNNCLRKKENKDKRIKEYIVDFYPIKILQLDFDKILNEIKVIYEESERKRIEELKKKSKEDRKKIEKEEKLIKKCVENIKSEYIEKIEEVEDLYNKKLIDKEFAEEKISILKKKYFDLRRKEQEIKVPKNKFF